jgi:hypothetical protein
MTDNTLGGKGAPPVTRSWMRGTAMNKTIRNGILGLSALVTTALIPQQTKAMGMNWGTPVDGGNYQYSTFEVTNDNPGTTYNSFTINSTHTLLNILLTLNTQYGSIQEMINGTDSQGRANFGLVINSDSGYVNNGWTVSLNENGAIQGVNNGTIFADKFNYEGIFNGDFAINESLLHGNPLQLAQNTQGLTDSALTSGGYQFETQAGYVPVPEPTMMALLAAGVADLGGGTNRAELAVTVSYALSFRVEYKDALTNATWQSLGSYSRTGAVTVVADTNTAPQRFYRAVAP